MPLSFSSLTFSLRGDGYLPCHIAKVLGTLSSNGVKWDLPSTLFAFCLLCLEHEDSGILGSLVGLYEFWLATSVTVDNFASF